MFNTFYVLLSGILKPPNPLHKLYFYHSLSVGSILFNIYHQAVMRTAETERLREGERNGQERGQLDSKRH